MPTPQEKLIDAHIGHSLDLLRLASGDWRQVKKILVELGKDLVKQIAEIDVNGPGQDVHRKRRLAKLLKNTQEIIKHKYEQIRYKQSLLLQDVAEYENAFTRNNLNTVIGADVAAESITAAQAKAVVSDTLILGASATDWWKRQEATTQAKFADAMRQGWLQGESIDQMVRRVRGTDSVTGIMDISKRDAESLVRTSVAAISGQSRVDTIERNSDILNGYVHVSTLDNRTTLQCMVRDGKKWNMDREPVGHSLPFRQTPIHWNCRSTIVPWLKSWEEFGIKFKNKVPEGTRSSMDGYVPKSLKYEDWLKTKPTDFQKDVLGKARYNLWKEGKLTLRQMVNTNDRPLTIDQLRKKL